MCGRALLALVLAGLACGSMAAPWKQAPDSHWNAAQLASFGSPLQALDMKQALGGGPGDLDPDPAFGTNGDGTHIYFLDYPNEKIGQGLRVYAIDGDTSWYVLAKHQRQGGYWDAVVIKVHQSGLMDTVYLVSTPLRQINDAVWDSVTRKFYFAGSGHPPALPGNDEDFGVTCVDIDSLPGGGTCAGFGAGGTAWVSFNLGSSNHDIATRVLVRPNVGLLLIGTAELTDHQDVLAVASLYRASGGLFNGFGTNGRFYTALVSPAPLHADVNVFDAALSSGADAQTRLYIAGNFSWDDALRHYDGYVIALKAMTGIIDDASFNPGSGGQWISLNLGNCSVNCRDAVTAISVQANGKLALAGWSTDLNLNQQLMLGRLNFDGSFDAAFKGGGLFSPLSPNYLLSHSSGFVIPKAIAERPDTHDLVVAMDGRRDGDPTSPVWQLLGQMSANAQVERAFKSFLFDAEPGPTVRWSTGAGLLVDADSAMLVGTRRWSATDDDVTLVRTVVNRDRAFSDGFEDLPAN